MPVESEQTAPSKRGEGRAMAGIEFRDPPDVEARAAALEVEIARTLVRAPSLPVELPAFDLTLLGVAPGAQHVDLVLGKSEPIAHLRITRSDDPTAAVEVDVVEVNGAAARFGKHLDKMARRLRPAISLEKWRRANRTARELAALPVGVPLAFYRQIVPGVDGQALVRVGFRCNQNCGICWQDRQWGTYGPEQILLWVEDLRNAGAHSLIISGGEPTLDPDLQAYIERAREVGFRNVTLETNAILFAKGRHAERLRSAGLSDCFVSLHSGDAATSDLITRAPGTFERTVAGIKALLDAAVPVRLNCVLTAEGIDHLESVPALVAGEFAGHPHFKGLMLSQPSDPFDPALIPSIVPEPSRLRQVLYRVIDRAFDLGISISGLDGPCGPPLCAFGADPRITDLAPASERLSGRTFLPACDACAVREACFGARNADVDLFAEACVAPLADRPARQRAPLPDRLTPARRSAKTET